MKKRSAIDNVFLLVPIAAVLVLAGQMVGLPLRIVQVLLENFATDIPGFDVMDTALLYYSFIGSWIVGLLFLLLIKRYRPIARSLWTKVVSGNTIGMLLLGLLIGFVMNGSVALVAILNGDIAIHFEALRPVGTIFVFIGVLIQSSSEEMLCRGFLYQAICKTYKPWVAMLANAILFGLLHISNPGVTVFSILNICLSGLLFSLVVYYFDSLWCAFGIHTAWNFTQNILFGLPNSGIVLPFSIFKLDRVPAARVFAYDPEFGIEGCIMADIVLAIGCLVIFLIGHFRKKKPTDIWATSGAAPATEPVPAGGVAPTTVSSLASDASSAE